MQLWDAKTGQHKATLTGHTRGVLSVAFSPDGGTLASGGRDDNTVRLWDAKTGQHKATLTGHWGWVFSVAFSPDGGTLASGSLDSTVRLWDAVTGQHKATLTGHTGRVYSVAFSPDGKTLASGGNDATVRLWDAVTGQHKATLTGHWGWVFSVAFSPDGKTLASGGNDAAVRLWDAATGQHKATIMGHTYWVESVAFSPDGGTLASGSGAGTVRLWDAKTGQHKATLTGHTNSVSSVAFSPDGGTLASGSSDKTVRLWDAKTGQHNATLGHTNSVISVAFSPDGNTLASGSGLEVRLWDAKTGQHKATLGHTDWVFSVAFSPDGNTLASGSREVRLWDAKTGQHKATLTGTGGVRSVAFSPDGGTLASGSWDGTTLLWELTPAATVNATVSISPPSVQSPAIGAQLTLSLNIADGQTVAGYQATVQFDTSALRYVESANGDYLPTGAFFVPPVVPGNQVVLAATSLSGESNGDGTLATLTFEVIAVKESTLTLSDVVLSDSAAAGSRPHIEDGEVVEPLQLTGDVNGDGVVNIQDLVLVAGRLGQTGQNDADANGDGVVNIQDLVLVAGALGSAAAAPSFHSQGLTMLTAADVKGWLTQAQGLHLTDATSQRGIIFLEQLLEVLTPKETTLLPNYPNPFNPETWIPYHLAHAADVTLTVYDTKGTVVRRLELGHQPAGFYTARSKAAYWDGRNDRGEQVASGVYFYQLRAGRSGLSVLHRRDYTALRRMVILK